MILLRIALDHPFLTLAIGALVGAYAALRIDSLRFARKAKREAGREIAWTEEQMRKAETTPRPAGADFALWASEMGGSWAR